MELALPTNRDTTDTARAASQAPADGAQRRLRTINELDHARLTGLLSRGQDGRHDVLALTLDQAQLVAPKEMPADVVTMYTQVQVDDSAAGALRTYTVCYPADAEPADGFVSVFSPVGTALLGARVGDRVEVMRPDGSSAQLEVRAILFQPEASGDYTT